MHLTIKEKQIEKWHVIQTIKKDKFASNIHNISRQIKEKIDYANSHLTTKALRLSRVSEKKRPIVPSNSHKVSLETACSYFSTCHHSAQKQKTVIFQNPESSFFIKDYLQNLQEKGSGYAIRWKNPVSTISKSMRVILGQWLINLADQLQIPKNSVYNAMNYVDKYVQMVSVPKSKYQFVGLCCLFLSAKLQMSSHPSISVFIEALQNTVSKTQLLQLEQEILFKLKFKLNSPTLYQYMVLLVSLFAHFLNNENNSQFVDISSDSMLYKDIFWILDGIHLQNQYRKFKNKQKVCLSILYMSIKKQRYSQAHIDRSKLLGELHEMKAVGQTEKVFELFLRNTIQNLQISDLKQCIQFYRKWVKFDRSSVSQEAENDLLKRIIFNS